METVLPYNEADENEGRIVFYPVPRFRRRNATAKIEPVKGLRVEPVNKKSSPFLKKDEEISENKKTHDKKAATNGVFRASR